MAVNKTTAPKVTVEAPAAAPAPEPSPDVRIRLVNGCSTYVTPEREVFYSRDSEGNPKVYAVPRDQLGRFLSYADDWGRRFFKQTDAEVTDEKPDTTAKVTQERGGKPAEEQHDALDPNDDDELDTGAMRLKDRNGDDAGVTV